VFVRFDVVLGIVGMIKDFKDLWSASKDATKYKWRAVALVVLLACSYPLMLAFDWLTRK
jgi:hypothetical protein